MLTDEIKTAIRDRYKALQDNMPGFRVRRSQSEMIGAVARGLTSEGGGVVIEAPTGTGKSLAYLLAAFEVAKATDKRLVIATATIALQEQLMQHDIEAFLEATGQEATVVLAKGRRRYACLREMSNLVGNDHTQQSIDLGELARDVWPRKPRPNEAENITRLLEDNLAERWNGDVDKSPIPIDDQMREIITTTAGGCSNKKCAFYNQCAFFKARRKLKDAQIIIANQNLLLADLAMSNGDDGTGGVVLPPPKDTIYVIDEGHHLGVKAVEQGAAHVAPAPAARYAKGMEGIMRAAYALVGKSEVRGMTLAQGNTLLNQYRKDLSAIVKLVQTDWTPETDEKTAGGKGKPGRYESEATWCAPGGKLSDAWQNQAVGLSAGVKEILRWAEGLHKTLAKAEGSSGEKVLGELGMACERWREQARLWSAWAIEDEETATPKARWVTLDARRSLMCHASGVNAAGALRYQLWDQAAGVVLTSATLSAGGNFHHLKGSVGFPDETECVSLSSPFDLPAQGKLEIPWMDNEPGAWQGHADEVKAWVQHHLDWDKGNLVLFTSKAKMRDVYSNLSVAESAKVLMQGTAFRNEIIGKHRKRIDEGEGSTLFGLASFGEGLDLPGAYLETVVVTQIPFQVPTDPVGSTYAKWLEDNGRNPFMEVTVPSATRTMVQYCGRLIRSETDVGRVVILDRRIINKRYGSLMLRALPPFGQDVGQRPTATAMQQKKQHQGEPAPF